MTLCAMAAPCSPMHALQTRQVKTSELGSILGQRKKPATRSMPCPLLPTTIPTVVPLQNPNSPAVAFYPDSTATNTTQLPPQIVGALTTIDQSMSPMPFEAPFNVSVCTGLEQVVFSAEAFTKTYNRDLAPDNVLNVLHDAFINMDGDFSFYNSGWEVDMRYDKFSNCFFFAEESRSEFGSMATQGIVFGVSDSGIISEDTNWTVISIGNGSLVPDANGCPGDINPDASVGVSYDYCRSGVDQYAYYFAFDILEGTNGLFYANSAFSVQKESLLNGGPAVVTAFRDVGGTPGDATPYRVNGTSLLIPVMNFDSNPEFGYFVQQDPFYWGKLNVYRVVNPGTSSPTLSEVLDIDVPTTYFISSPSTLAPFLGNQYSFLGGVNDIDDRLKMAHVRNHQLFAVQTILTDSTGVGSSNGDRYALRWYQLDLTGDPTGNGNGTETVSTVPALVQAGTLFDPSEIDPIWYYLPAIMTNKNGDLSVSGVLSGNNQSISSFNTGRRATDPLGVLRTGPTPIASVFQEGSGSFTQGLGTVSQFPNITTTFGQRISDRSYTCFDPVNDLSMWTAQQFIADGKLQWAIARLDPAI